MAGRTLVVLSCLGLIACLSAWAADEAPDPREWLRIEHPDYPFSLELPEDAHVQMRTAFSLAEARADDRRRIDVSLFGLRALSETRVRYDAVELGFFWVTEDYAGVDARALDRLSRTLADREDAERFLRAVFYGRGGASIALADAGRGFVQGFAVQRFAVRKTIAAGTAHERHVEGEVVVMPISAEATLVAFARFDPAATPAERGRDLPRIVESLRLIDDATPDARVL